MKLVISKSTYTQIVDDCESSPDKEVCGLGFSEQGKVFGTDLMVDNIHKAQNISQQELSEYQFGNEDFGLFIKYHRRILKDKKMLMIWHSHPRWKAYPSQFDITKAHPNYIYLIYSNTEKLARAFVLENVDKRVMAEVPIEVR